MTCLISVVGLGSAICWMQFCAKRVSRPFLSEKNFCRWLLFLDQRRNAGVRLRFEADHISSCVSSNRLHRCVPAESCLSICVVYIVCHAQDIRSHVVLLVTGVLPCLVGMMVLRRFSDNMIEKSSLSPRLCAPLIFRQLVKFYCLRDLPFVVRCRPEQCACVKSSTTSL